MGKIFIAIVTIYENNDFYFEESEKKLFENFINFWSENPYNY